MYQFTAWRRTAQRNATTMGWVSQLFGSTGLETLIWHILTFLCSRFAITKKSATAILAGLRPTATSSMLSWLTVLSFYSLQLIETSYDATRNKPFTTEGRRKKYFWEQHFEIPAQSHFFARIRAVNLRNLCRTLPIHARYVTQVGQKSDITQQRER